MRILPRVFNFWDVSDQFKSQVSYENWLNGALRRGEIKQIRRGLYALVDPSTGFIYANKFEIGSKVFMDAVICYHSALDYYGLANQVFNNVYVGTYKRFRDFYFEDIVYQKAQLHDKDGITIQREPFLRVTDLERTIVDCIDDVGMAGGIDELLNALLSVTRLDEKKVIEYLDCYNSVYLYQKAGYLFEMVQEKMRFSNAFYEHCMKKETNQKKYFLKGECDNLKYNAKWKLIAPRNLLSRAFEGIE